MKEIIVQIPDDKELMWDKDLNAFKVVDADEIEASNILKDFETDINKLFEKYYDRLNGKFSINANICFTAYRDCDNHKTHHWVEKTCAIDVTKGEADWHD